MRRTLNEAKLWLIAIPVLLWTLLPIYHLFILSISNQQAMMDGRLWPTVPTLQNYEIVIQQKHYYLTHFWRQFGTSVLVALATGFFTLLIATLSAFAISRLRVAGGRMVMNLALATYLIPAAFLAVPMYKTMGAYGLLETKTSLILCMVALASPYAIWVLKQASDKLPIELDEAATVDGASVGQLFRLIYLPMMKPAMVAIGIYAIILAWNEYLYAFLMISKDQDVPLAVGLGTFLGADDSPWNVLMAAALVYAIPPTVIYYVFRKYMVSGLTAGAVKS
jgi:multiple sugar transport system permease protein